MVALDDIFTSEEKEMEVSSQGESSEEEENENVAQQKVKATPTVTREEELRQKRMADQLKELDDFELEEEFGNDEEEDVVPEVPDKAETREMERHIEATSKKVQPKQKEAEESEEEEKEQTPMETEERNQDEEEEKVDEEKEKKKKKKAEKKKKQSKKLKSKKKKTKDDDADKPEKTPKKSKKRKPERDLLELIKENAQGFLMGDDEDDGYVPSKDAEEAQRKICEEKPAKRAKTSKSKRESEDDGKQRMEDRMLDLHMDTSKIMRSNDIVVDEIQAAPMGVAELSNLWQKRRETTFKSLRPSVVKEKNLSEAPLYIERSGPDHDPDASDEEFDYGTGDLLVVVPDSPEREEEEVTEISEKIITSTPAPQPPSIAPSIFRAPTECTQDLDEISEKDLSPAKTDLHLHYTQSQMEETTKEKEGEESGWLHLQQTLTMDVSTMEKPVEERSDSEGEEEEGGAGGEEGEDSHDEGSDEEESGEEGEGEEGEGEEGEGEEEEGSDEESADSATEDHNVSVTEDTNVSVPKLSAAEIEEKRKRKLERLKRIAEIIEQEAEESEDGSGGSDDEEEEGMDEYDKNMLADSDEEEEEMSEELAKEIRKLEAMEDTEETRKMLRIVRGAWRNRKKNARGAAFDSDDDEGPTNEELNRAARSRADKENEPPQFFNFFQEERADVSLWDDAEEEEEEDFLEKRHASIMRAERAELMSSLPLPEKLMTEESLSLLSQTSCATRTKKPTSLSNSGLIARHQRRRMEIATKTQKTATNTPTASGLINFEKQAPVLQEKTNTNNNNNKPAAVRAKPKTTPVQTKPKGSLLSMLKDGYR
ncbi:hypothetical protein PROFUN_07705 [Planoprotostelium fungivorum]|uniref:DNA replication checkpoint mediator MRC1 domain-containing protein n=1 Tax=Planoprotostelium fungivorum TaxID=1890364 RepID=A0A2P6MM78_9EUKA|nr:hypothetical protein PROFUN_07705 [Planoprotostelium fungivorum]